MIKAMFALIVVPSVLYVALNVLGGAVRQRLYGPDLPRPYHHTLEIGYKEPKVILYDQRKEYPNGDVVTQYWPVEWKRVSDNWIFPSNQELTYLKNLQARLDKQKAEDANKPRDTKYIFKRSGTPWGYYSQEEPQPRVFTGIVREKKAEDEQYVKKVEFPWKYTRVAGLWSM